MRNGPQIVTNGLVLAVDAADRNSYPESGTVSSDLSGNSNNGTLTNGVAYSPTKQGTFIFDGVDDYISCGNGTSLNVGNNITVNSWFYVNSSSIYQPIVAKVLLDYSLGWEFANSSGQLRATLRPSATLIEAYAGTLTVGNWYMGSMTFDNTTLRLYVNGVQSAASTGGPVTLNSTEPLTIGRRIQLNYYNGNIANVFMYNRALTASEIQQNFNALRGRFGI